MKAVKAVTWKSRNPKYSAYIFKFKFFMFKDKTTSISSGDFSVKSTSGLCK